MMIRAVGAASLIATHASMPDRFGIRTSIRITSGTAVAGSSVAAPPLPPPPVPRLADHVDVLLDAEKHGQSSPKQLLVVDNHHPDRLTAACAALDCGGNRSEGPPQGLVEFVVSHPCHDRVPLGASRGLGGGPTAPCFRRDRGSSSRRER